MANIGWVASLSLLHGCICFSMFFRLCLPVVIWFSFVSWRIVCFSMQAVFFNGVTAFDKESKGIGGRVRTEMGQGEN